MTAEEKRDRRQARHQVAAALKRVNLHRVGLYSTGPQIRANLRVLVDRYYSEQINPAVQRIIAEKQAEAAK